MASPMLIKVVACLAVVCMVLCTTPIANAALSCGQMQLTVAPCIGYVRGLGGNVPGPCCNGLRNLNSQARTTPQRQDACRCLKTLAGTIPGLNLPILAGLPAKCGINLPFKVSPSINCNTVV